MDGLDRRPNIRAGQRLAAISVDAQDPSVNQRVLGSSPSPGAITAGHGVFLPAQPFVGRAPWSQNGHEIRAAAMNRLSRYEVAVSSGVRTGEDGRPSR